MNVIKEIYKFVSRRKKAIEVKKQQNEILRLIEKEDFLPIKNERISECKVITFIIPGMIKHSGGRTSILRLGTYLCNDGYTVNYISYNNQCINEMQENAYYNLNDYRGNIYSSDYMYKIKSDIIVATNWQSVYYAKKYDGYKMYFIQDYEPYFHPYGEFFLLAKKTYQLGFHMVSLGVWNKCKIEKESNVERIDVVDFPYEREEYSYRKKNYAEFKGKKEYSFAVYIKKEGKRLPVLIQVMMKKVKELFEDEGITLKIFFFGMDKKEKVMVGKNLGKLNKQELETLYHKVDFGMVASMSNISLIPYEMIATGLPIIEFEDGTFPYFFKEESAILTSFSYKELYNKLKYCIENPEKLAVMQEAAYEQLKNLSWEKTGKQFSTIIENICI